MDLNQKPSDFKTALKILNKYNVFSECKNIAIEFVNKSLQSIEIFPDSIIKDRLKGLASESINRSK